MRQGFTNWLPAVILSTWVAMGGACSSGNQNQDAAPLDLVTFDFSFGDLPPGCPPSVGNNKGIGAPCTMNGGECGKLGLRCACDVFLTIQPPQGTPCFCTNLSFALCKNAPADYCGQNATCCGYQDQGSLCVPNACLDSAMCPVF